MQTATVVMQMSSEDALATVVTALEALAPVTVDAPPWATYRQLVITIETSDPDMIDIVREIVWQFDGLAIQHSVLIDHAG